MDQQKRHIVIVGAGFAGLGLAKKLNNKPGILVTLIDQLNYHQFQPLLPQVATAGLDASEIAFPLRNNFRHSRNLKIELGRVLKVLPESDLLITNKGMISYDSLVIATGCSTNFYGKKRIKKYALPLKSAVQALEIRDQLLQNLETASRLLKHKNTEYLYNIVIAGGGPTGVELSSAFAEMKRKILPGDFPELDLSRMSIYLLEKGKCLLPAMSGKSRYDSEAYLTRMGVKVQCRKGVADYDGKTVLLNDGSNIQSALLVWTAGIEGCIPEGFEASCLNEQKRLKVDQFNRVKGCKNIYALGDVCVMQTEEWPQGHQQLASVARDQGKNLATNLLRGIRKKESTPFKYRDRGMMVAIAGNRAVVDHFLFRKSHFRGWIAWIMWLSFQLYRLLCIKKRLSVFINWGCRLITYRWGRRLILKPLPGHQK